MKSITKQQWSDLDNSLINRALESIENKTGKMAHEIPEIRGNLRKWQDGRIGFSVFKEQLNKIIDRLNEA